MAEYWLIDPLRKQAEFYQRGPAGFFHVLSPDTDGRYHVDWLWQNPPLNILDVLREWEC